VGKVEAICVSAEKGDRKKPVDSAIFRADHGIEGDAHAGALDRQVSVLPAEEIDVVRKNDLSDVKPGDTEKLKQYCDGRSIDLVVTVGGTGFSPRDVTPEATRSVVERPAPGLDEAMRAASLSKTPNAILARGASGIRGSTLIINLPGSERAAVENLRAIIGALPHGLEKLRGDTSDCGTQ
jgi:molybdenum cofactor synthesis domain-containing protein